jgi:UDPglucose 6-dehydrogenase
MRYVNGIEEAAEDADALLILTDWREFARIDLAQLHAVMRYPIVIDGRNLYDPQQMLENGFTYLSIGRPSATPVREDVRLAV